MLTFVCEARFRKPLFEKRGMRYQVEFRLRPTLQELEVEGKAVAAELGINPPQFERLCDGDWTHISRADFQKLLCWGKKHDKQLIAIVENPLWRTFSKRDVVVLRGKSDTGNPLASDSDVETELLSALEQQQCRIQTRAMDVEEAKSSIPNLMSTTNCIFIGSPKLNAASEVALAELWALKPFDSTKRNQERSPLLFLWESGYNGRSGFGRPANDGEEIGIYVGTRDANGITKQRHVAPVDWKPQKAYANWTGKARDAGAIVACYKPLNSQAEVTSIVLAGHSGFATRDMALDFVGDGLRFEVEELRPGAPIMKVLSAPYKKTSGSAGSRVRLVRGRRWFGLPWTDLDSVTKRRAIRKRH